MKANKTIVRGGIAVILVLMSVAGIASEEPVNAYHTALDRWTSDYLIATIEMIVQVGDNTPAVYSMMLWAKGMDTASSVITDADVDFLLGLSMLQEARQVTAWWPTLERSKTFASTRTDEEIGFGGGWMEQVAQHPEEYEAVFLSEDTETWTIELLPLSEEPLFHQGVIYVRKERCTIVRAEFFDAEGILVEEDRITEHTELVNASGASILYPSRLEIHDVEEDKITRISYLSLEFPDSIEETRFSLEAIQELSRQVLEGKL